MNYLAHLLLVGPDPDHRVGALLGDFMRGEDLAAFPLGLQKGVLHHREVDRFTDAHPVFRRSRARLDARFRRFSGVIIDVCYDHFLARRFADYSLEPLGGFAAGVYRDLASRRAAMPERMQRVVARMTKDDWLASYRETSSVAQAFRGMSRRVRRENPLGAAGEQLLAHYDALDADFVEFFAAARAQLARGGDG